MVFIPMLTHASNVHPSAPTFYKNVTVLPVTAMNVNIGQLKLFKQTTNAVDFQKRTVTTFP